MGIDGKIGVYYNHPNSPASTHSKTRQININPAYKNLISLDNIFNVRSILKHEKNHKYDKSGVDITYFHHAEIYLDQMLDDTFLKTDKEFQLSTISSFLQFVMNSGHKEKGSPQTLINKFNSENKLGYNVSVDYEKGAYKIIDNKANKTYSGKYKSKENAH